MAFLFRSVIRNSLVNIVLFKMLHKNYSGLNAPFVWVSVFWSLNLYILSVINIAHANINRNCLACTYALTCQQLHQAFFLTLPTHTERHTHKHTRHATTCRPYWLVGAENVAANCCKLHIKTVKRPKPWGGQLTVCVCVFYMCACVCVSLWCALRCSHFYFHVHSHSLSICRTLNSHILVAQVVKALTGGATAAPTSCVAGSPSPRQMTLLH